MGDKSAIEWTDSTWNPVTGCSKVSPGCAHCYAEALSLRYGWSTVPWTPAHAAQNVILHPERLDLPLRWRKPRRIFVNSMSDLFHELVPIKYIVDVFAVMATAQEHTFQVLTKRPERMQQLLSDAGFVDLVSTTMARRAADRGWCLDEVEEWPLPNVWLGTSVENQRWADVRVPLLLKTPAVVRFLSCEPLLGPVDLRRWLLPTRDYYGQGGVAWRSQLPSPIHWIIAGGESGPHFRPVNLDWVRGLRDQCTEAGVRFLFKQVGGRTPKSGGRLLDGRTWDEYPA